MKVILRNDKVYALAESLEDIETLLHLRNKESKQVKQIPTNNSLQCEICKQQLNTSAGLNIHKAMRHKIHGKNHNYYLRSRAKMLKKKQGDNISPVDTTYPHPFDTFRNA